MTKKIEIAFDKFIMETMNNVNIINIIVDGDKEIVIIWFIRDLDPSESNINGE